MKREGINKKAQELSITTLILIVLGVIILVLLVLGFTKGWDFIFGKFDLLPGQNLEAVAQSCKVSAQSGLKIDYCGFKKIKLDSKTEYVNCLDDRLQGSIDVADKLTQCTFSTGHANLDAAGSAQYYCQDILNGTTTCPGTGSLAIVNGIACCKK
jgi:hypothetical protein